MQRSEAIDILARTREGAISVATMQSVAPWHDAGQADGLHLDASQCMGSSASLGLGLALAQPDRRVIVLDGDGSLLMQLGSLVSVAAQAPANLYHFVFANGRHQSTGNQPLPGQGRFDWCAMALGAGYAHAERIEGAEELIERLPALYATKGPVLVELVIEPESTEPRWAGVPMSKQIAGLRATLAS